MFKVWCERIRYMQINMCSILSSI